MHHRHLYSAFRPIGIEELQLMLSVRRILRELAHREGESDRIFWQLVNTWFGGNAFC